MVIMLQLIELFMNFILDKCHTCSVLVGVARVHLRLAYQQAR
jgi:hypothetical protein